MCSFYFSILHHYMGITKKVIRDRLSTNFDPRLEPVDVKNLQNSIFCQQSVLQTAAFRFAGHGRQIHKPLKL